MSLRFRLCALFLVAWCKKLNCQLLIYVILIIAIIQFALLCSLYCVVWCICLHCHLYSLNLCFDIVTSKEWQSRGMKFRPFLPSSHHRVPPSARPEWVLLGLHYAWARVAVISTISCNTSSTSKSKLPLSVGISISPNIQTRIFFISVYISGPISQTYTLLLTWSKLEKKNYEDEEGILNSFQCRVQGIIWFFPFIPLIYQTLSCIYY